MRRLGQFSRIVNPLLTPVTHPLLPNSSAPGQLSVKQILKSLTAIGELAPKKFYVVGTPISHSRSPVLHGTGYEVLGLPHTFHRFETDDADKVFNEIVKGHEEFGGCCITIPLKIKMMKYATQLSDSAKTIGAINTLYPVGNGEYYGTNTDWIGITESFRRNGFEDTASTGLVIGGGGTSRAAVYALREMGCKEIYMLNRTVSKVEEIKESFPADYNIKVLSSLSDIETISRVDLIVSTVPANVELDAIYLANIKAALSKGVRGASYLIEAAYKPETTPIMSIASEEFGLHVIPGKDMLVNQGVAQFKYFCHIDAPYDEVYAAVTSE
jgi:pentafunctional AROM polypeptide